MNRITVRDIIEYYDGIVLFIGVDSVGNSYMCMLVLDENIDEERYLSVKVTDDVIQNLVSGKTTLLDVFTNPIDEEYFWADVGNEDLTITLTKIDKGFKPTKEMLPDAGYKFSMPQYD